MSNYKSHFIVLNLAAVSTMLAAVPVLAASVSEHMPPPGLYRINGMNSQFRHAVPGTEVQRRDHTDGATGDVTSTHQAGNVQATTHVSGNGPSTMCIPPTRALSPETLPAPAGCPGVLGVAGPNGMVFKQHCSFGDMVTTTRKIDATTWQYETSYTVSSAQAAAPVSGQADIMRQFAENLVANGNEKQRAQGLEALKHMPEFNAQMAAQKAQRAAMAPQMAQMRAQAAAEGIAFPENQPMVEQKAVYTITKIGNTCSH